jgi:multidrug efflux pump subunit AcrB
VLVATAALIIVLCPVALTPGLGGFLFKPLTLAVAFAMLASFLLSWTFVPALCSKMLRGHGHAARHHSGLFARFYHRFDSALGFASRLYERLLGFALRHRLMTLLAVGALFAASLTQFAVIGQEFFPPVDAGQIAIQVRAPSNLRLDATERRVLELEEFIEQSIPEPERAMIVSEIGLNNDWSAAYSANAGQQDAVIRIQLTERRARSAQEYAVLLRKRFADDPRFVDLQFSFDTGGMVTAALNYGASSPIDIQVSGGTPDKAMDLAHAIRRQVATVPGTADVRVLQRNDAPYLMIELDRQKAADIGLSARDVVMQVVTAMNSSIALTRNFWIDPQSGNQYFVAVPYPDNPSFRVEDL